MVLYWLRRQTETGTTAHGVHPQPGKGEFAMTTDEFMKQQFLTLRDEIRESKARIFWLLIIGILLVMVAGYLAAEHPNAFANAAIPFLLLALMLAFVAEQNNIARAGRYLREMVEPRITDLPCWEKWR